MELKQCVACDGQPERKKKSKARKQIYAPKKRNPLVVMQKIEYIVPMPNM